MLAKFPDFNSKHGASTMIRSSPRASTFGVLAFILIILYTFKLAGPTAHYVQTDSTEVATGKSLTPAIDVSGSGADSNSVIPPAVAAEVVEPEKFLEPEKADAAVEADKPIVLVEPPKSISSISQSADSTSTSPLASKTSLPNKELWNTTGFVPFLSGKKVAAIIEDRALDNLMPIILHFSAVLGPEWPIVLFTSIDIIPNSAPIQRLIQNKLLFIEDLPKSVHFEDHQSVSAFLTKPWLWDHLAPADHVLVFQADSMICANSPQRIDDFIKYDLVGAPIDTTKFGHGYNGGLSLRNRNLILDIIRSADFDAEELVGEGAAEAEFEDQWFYKKMTELPERPSPTNSSVLIPGASLPAEDIAMKFAVETIPYDWPLGYHQPARWQPDHMEQIEKWCPEVKMVTDDLIALRGKEKEKDCEEKLAEWEAKTWQDLKREEEERKERERLEELDREEEEKHRIEEEKGKRR